MKELKFSDFIRLTGIIAGGKNGKQLNKFADMIDNINSLPAQPAKKEKFNSPDGIEDAEIISIRK